MYSGASFICIDNRSTFVTWDHWGNSHETVFSLCSSGDLQQGMEWSVLSGQDTDLRICVTPQHLMQWLCSQVSYPPGTIAQNKNTQTVS